MSDERTETKALAGRLLSQEPKPSVERRVSPQSPDFGDPALTRPGIAPLGSNERDKRALQHLFDNVGLALSPAQLPLLVTLLPLVASGRRAVLGAFSGMLLGAALVASVQAPIVRYGVTLTVLARSAYGVRGAWMLGALRVLLSLGLFCEACVLATETLVWCVLCAFPSLTSWFQRVPLFGSFSLLSAACSAALLPLAWRFAREPHGALRVLLALIALGFSIALFLLPGNLPPHAAWDVVEMAGRSQSTSIVPVLVSAMFWAASTWLIAASDARRLPSQAAQIAASFFGVVPWIFATLAFALAVLSSGHGASAFFDLPALACRRLPASALLPFLGVAALGFLVPLAYVCRRSVEICAQEMASGERERKLIAWTGVVVVGLFALLSHAGFLPGLLEAQLGLGVVYVVMSACVAAQYYGVERKRLVLEELYLERGPYRGIWGISPAGLLALVATGAAYVLSARRIEAQALRAGLLVPVAALAQIMFGNVQRLLLR